MGAWQAGGARQAAAATAAALGSNGGSSGGKQWHAAVGAAAGSDLPHLVKEDAERGMVAGWRRGPHRQAGIATAGSC